MATVTMPAMESVKIGRLARAVRLRLRLRQIDLARRARVSQSMISRLERGLVAQLRIAELDRICTTLGIRLEIIGTWRGRDAVTVFDSEHAAIVELLVKELISYGWEVLVEYGFNYFGDRGIVDIVAWHRASRTLLIVEVKTLIVDVQNLLGTFNRKVRVVPEILAAERGWVARNVGRLLVVRGSHPARDAIGRHAATFATELPASTNVARAWLRDPSGPMAGVMFITESRLRTITQRAGRSQRVRHPRSRVAVHESS